MEPKETLGLPYVECKFVSSKSVCTLILWMATLSMVQWCMNLKLIDVFSSEAQWQCFFTHFLQTFFWYISDAGFCMFNKHFKFLEKKNLFWMMPSPSCTVLNFNLLRGKTSSRLVYTHSAFMFVYFFLLQNASCLTIWN